MPGQINLSSVHSIVWAEEIERQVRTHGGRFARFGTVGISGIFVKTGVLWILVAQFGINSLVAAAISSEVSILTNFVLNDFWTFSDTPREVSYLEHVAHYHAVTLAGVLLSVVLYGVLSQALGMNYLLANLISIGAVTISNYALNIRFTWSTGSGYQSPTLIGPDISAIK